MPSENVEKILSEPDTPKYPEILGEAHYLPDGRDMEHRLAIVLHSLCNLVISHSLKDEIKLNVFPQGELYRNGRIVNTGPGRRGFGLDIYGPSGACMFWYGGKSEEENWKKAIPGGVIPRPTNPKRHMLTPSGHDSIITAMRYGSVIGDAKPKGYGKSLDNIDTLHRVLGEDGIRVHPADLL